MKSQQLSAKKTAASMNPDFIALNIQDINFDVLASYGIKACFIDLDGTVVNRGSYDVSERIIKTLRSTKMKIYIATNRPKSRDLKNLKDSLNASGVIHPHKFWGKPTKKYFENGLEDKNLQRHEVVMVGDRYIQDIFGANRAGIYSLLIKKLDKPTGFFDTLISKAEQIYTNKISKRYY